MKWKAILISAVATIAFVWLLSATYEVGYRKGVDTYDENLAYRLEPVCINELNKRGYNQSCIEYCLLNQTVNITKYNEFKRALHYKYGWPDLED